MKVLVTGSSGLIGSEAVTYYDQKGDEVIGVDNNMRASFFGPQGDTSWNLERLIASTRNFTHLPIDIRDKEQIDNLFQEHQFDVIIHCAAQPSHDKAKEIPLIDFEVNALGTMILLEATRLFCPEAAFIHMSTNKVYGDGPNRIPLVELETRWEFANEADYHGIAEDFGVDQNLHSLFGASKTSADIMVQEYGRYFNMKTVAFRGGCLTGASHSGVQLHGFLSYLVKAVVTGTPYTIFGYKGKQVRDQIHSFDVIQAFEAYIQNPRPGEVYNLGGGRGNSASILEATAMIEDASGKKLNSSYTDENRVGDHICYISDLRKLKDHYPNWDISIGLEEIIDSMVKSELSKLAVEN